MALNSLFCADVPLSNYSLTTECEWLISAFQNHQTYTRVA